MNILLNGEAVAIDGQKPENLQAFLVSQGYKVDTIAVAINQSFVSRDTYQSTQIKDNDEIDVVAPISGG